MHTNSLMRHALAAAVAAGPLLMAANATYMKAAAAPLPLDVQRGEREVTIPAGTQLRLRLDSSHASNTSRVEDVVQAHLAAPLVVNGRTVLPANTAATGHVTVARPSAKVKGRAYLAVRFTEVRPDDERYRVSTRTWAREAPGTKRKDAAKIAVPGAVGAVVGAAIDGRKGAAIGAGVGAGAGTAVVLSTAGEEVRLPRGSTLLVRLSAPLTVRVRA
jgi:hypothetical protein